MIPTISPTLRDQVLEANEGLNLFCKTMVIGTEVVWKDGRFKGRKAVVTKAFWEIAFEAGKDILQILVLVKTERADGAGYMTSWDDYHRQYRDLHRHFK